MKKKFEQPKTYIELLEYIRKSPQSTRIPEFIAHLNQQHADGKIMPSIFEFLVTKISREALDEEKAFQLFEFFWNHGLEVHQRKGLLLLITLPHPKLFEFVTKTMRIRAEEYRDHPLPLCNKNKNPQTYQSLIERIAEYSGQGDTVYTYAARVNNLELMQHTYTEYPDPSRLDIPDDDGMTPWLHAILEGHREILSFLDAQGVAQNAYNKNGESFAHLLFKSKNHAFVKEIFENNIYQIQDKLTEASPSSNPPINMLIKYGEVSWLALWLEKKSERPTDLAAVAVRSNRLDMLSFLHENYHYPVQDLLADCATIEIADWLKERGAHFFETIQTNTGCVQHPNIMTSICQKNHAMTEWYLKNYAWDFKACHGDERHRYSILTYLMEYRRFDLITKYDLLKDKSLFFCEHSFMEDIDMFAAPLADVFPETVHDFYIFVSYLGDQLKKHYASQYPVYGFSGKSQVLLEALLDIGAIDKGSFVNDGIVDGTPAWMTYENHLYFEAMRQKEFHAYFMSTATFLAQHTEEQKAYLADPYSKKMAKFFQTYSPDVNQRDKNQQSILCRLIQYGAEALPRIQWFIENTDIDLRNLDQQGSTLLHLAAQTGSVEIIQWIFDYKNPKTQRSLIQTGQISLQTNQNTPEKYHAFDIALIHEHETIAEILWGKITDGTKKDYLASKLRQEQYDVLEILKKNDYFGWKPTEESKAKMPVKVREWLFPAPPSTEELPMQLTAASLTVDNTSTHQVIEEVTPALPILIDYSQLLNIIRTDNLFQFKEIKRLSKENLQVCEQLKQISHPQKFELFATALDVSSYRILNQMLRIEAFEKFITEINTESNYIQTLMAYIIKRTNYKALCIFLKYENILEGLTSQPNILYSLIRLALDEGKQSIVQLLLSHPAFQAILPEIVALQDNYLFRTAASYAYLDLLFFLAQFESVRAQADCQDNAALRQVALHNDEEACRFLLTLPAIADAIRKDGYAFMKRIDLKNEHFLINFLYNVPEIIHFLHLEHRIAIPIYPVIFVQFIPYHVQTFSIETLEKDIMFSVVNGSIGKLSKSLQQYGALRPDALKKISKLALVTRQFSILHWLIEQDYQQTIKQDPEFCFELLYYVLGNQFPFQEVQYLLDIYLFNGMQRHNDTLIKISIRHDAAEAINYLFSKDFDCNTLEKSTKIQLGRYLCAKNLETLLHALLDSEKEDQQGLKADILGEEATGSSPKRITISSSSDTFFQRAKSTSAPVSESTLSLKGPAFSP